MNILYNISVLLEKIERRLHSSFKPSLLVRKWDHRRAAKEKAKKSWQQIQ